MVKNDNSGTSRIGEIQIAWESGVTAGSWTRNKEDIFTQPHPLSTEVILYPPQLSQRSHPALWGDGPGIDFRSLGSDWFQPMLKCRNRPSWRSKASSLYARHGEQTMAFISRSPPAYFTPSALLSQRRAMHKSIALCPKRWWTYLEPAGFPEVSEQEHEMYLGSVPDPASPDGKSVLDGPFLLGPCWSSDSRSQYI